MLCVSELLFFTVLLFYKKVQKVNLCIIGFAATTGLVLFSEFCFLTYGIKGTTASAAGFLTSTTVIFVPVLQLIITRKKPQWKIFVGTILTIVGIALLTLQVSLTINLESVLCIIGALMNAWYIILVDRYAHKVDGLLLGVFQLAFAGFYGLLANVIFETPKLPASITEWGAILGLALICNAFGFVM